MKRREEGGIGGWTKGRRMGRVEGERGEERGKRRERGTEGGRTTEMGKKER